MWKALALLLLSADGARALAFTTRAQPILRAPAAAAAAAPTLAARRAALPALMSDAAEPVPAAADAAEPVADASLETSAMSKFQASHAQAARTSRTHKSLTQVSHTILTTFNTQLLSHTHIVPGITAMYLTAMYLCATHHPSICISHRDASLFFSI